MKKLMTLGMYFMLSIILANSATASQTPKVTVTTNTGTTICLGTNVTFSAAVSYATNVTYQWHRLRGGKWVEMKNGTNATLTTISIQNADEFRCAVVAHYNGKRYDIHGSIIMKVNPVPAAPAKIYGAESVYVDSTQMLTDATPNGEWSSSNTSVATVSTNGMVTGISSGNASISYKVSNSYGCSNMAKITMGITPPPPTITSIKPKSICTSTPTTLTIYGNNFKSVNRVMIGGILYSSYTVNTNASPNTITVPNVSGAK